MVTRRRLLKSAVVAAVAARQASRARGDPARPTGDRPGRLDPRDIRKYAAPLPVPPVMPAASPPDGPDTHYVIEVRPVRRQVLPPGAPATAVWAYGPAGDPGAFGWPGRTIEAVAGRPVRVTWVNGLTGRDGRPLPHLFAVDPTVHWADPPRRGHRAGHTPAAYRGPVPIVTHLHGGRNAEESDGHPEAWYLPAARDIPAGYATEGPAYSGFRALFRDATGAGWPRGAAVAEYGNRQAPATLWYHDHVLGMTRLNVYAGLAGFYLIRGGPADLDPGVLPGPAPRAGDPPDAPVREIPIVVQDRSFNADGSLYYPANRAAAADGFAGPYLPHGQVHPIWVPEFFGDAMTANGRTWPVLAVEPRRYRLRLLNGCNARFLILKIASDPLARRPAAAVLPLWQIGADAGFLPAPVRLEGLLLAPAERADVIVDFTGIRPGTELYLINEGPDGPFQRTAGTPPADPRTTGQVLKFVFRPLAGPDASVPPGDLSLPSPGPLGAATSTRRVALLESTATGGPGKGLVVAALLGTAGGATPAGGTPLRWADPATERPATGTTEIWEIHNTTMDAHPIHLHEVHLRVVDRGRPGGPVRPAEPGERGAKDTVIAYPGEVTRISATFDRAGRFVWHCHILEHEDNEMMRPLHIGG
ncbi:multicopper oxidase [Sphaerisporangium rufum]|uniref:Multicopper oxidase n=1 Tax=Sphaerisporangium rufum TaxID=1381558 RepID=A0A919V395_9ACTN|nr:multicopper oxidase [Sphaerisporangium rufum]GII81494.1 multicopper oxidase [Sphaerisporangium rufum]